MKKHCMDKVKHTTIDIVDNIDTIQPNEDNNAIANDIFGEEEESVTEE